MADWVDNYHDEEQTFDAGPHWKPPVSTRDRLPVLADEGDARLVEDGDVVYIYTNGRWLLMSGGAV